MKLITKEIAAKLPPLYSTETTPAEDKVAVLKLFDPCGRFTLYAVEGQEDDGDMLLFGYVVSPLGADCDEWGYSSLNELASVKGRLGLGIERDLHFKPTPMREILKYAA